LKNKKALIPTIDSSRMPWWPTRSTAFADASPVPAPDTLTTPCEFHAIVLRSTRISFQCYARKKPDVARRTIYPFHRHAAVPPCTTPCQHTRCPAAFISIRRLLLSPSVYFQFRSSQPTVCSYFFCLLFCVLVFGLLLAPCPAPPPLKVSSAAKRRLGLVCVSLSHAQEPSTPRDSWPPAGGGRRPSSAYWWPVVPTCQARMAPSV